MQEKTYHLKMDHHPYPDILQCYQYVIPYPFALFFLFYLLYLIKVQLILYTLRILSIKNSLAFLLIMIYLPVTSHAIDLSDDLTLHGFGTLGMVYNDDDDVGYLRDLSQPNVGSGIGDISFTQDTMFGLQMSYQPSDDFSATLQVVSKYKYNRSYSPEVTWAFLKYNPTPDIGGFQASCRLKLKFMPPCFPFHLPFVFQG